MIAENKQLSKTHLPRLLVCLTLLLTFVSFGIIIYNAGTEPFMVVHTGEILGQIGLSCVLLLLWLQLALGVLVGIVKRRLSFWFLAVPFWACCLCNVLWFCIIGYIHDVQIFASVRP